jgi:hypothetical protein
LHRAQNEASDAEDNYKTKTKGNEVGQIITAFWAEKPKDASFTGRYEIVALGCHTS